MSAIASIAMMTPKLLKEFRLDFETIRASLPTARLHLSAEKDLRRAKDTMRRTREARLDVGRALNRIYAHETWRDSHGSWAAMCRALKLPRWESYELMNGAGVTDSLPPADVASFPEGLSRQQLRTLAKADEDERKATVHEAADAVEPSGVNDPFAALRQSLAVAPRTALNDEAPMQPKAGNGLAWVKRYVTSMVNWFEARGLGDVAKRTPLEELPALAETAGETLSEAYAKATTA